MLGKLVLYSVAFVTAWAGIVLAFRGYIVPGVMVLGIGYVVFNVVHPIEE